MPYIRLCTPKSSNHSTMYISNTNMTSDVFRKSQSINVCHPGFTRNQHEPTIIPLPWPDRPGGLSPSLTTKKSNSSSSSKANATWYHGQTQPRTKNVLLKQDLLGLSLHSATEALIHHEDKRVKTASSKSRQHKPSFLKDDPEVINLLKLLQTTNFVGEIDPIHHSRYITMPEEEEPKISKFSFDFKEMQHCSTSIMASYNSDDHLHSPMQTTKRGLRL
jgi:hypothetical protein